MSVPTIPGGGPPAEDPVGAALLRVTFCGAALTAELERLTQTATELSENPGGWEHSARSAQIAAALREVEEREADLGLACLELQCELVRWESRP